MTHESPVCLRVVSKALLCKKLFARKVEVNEETQVLDQLRGRNKHAYSPVAGFWLCYEINTESQGLVVQACGLG